MPDKRPLSDAEFARDLEAIAQRLSGLAREPDSSIIGKELESIRAHLKQLGQANTEVRRSLGREPND